MSVLCGDVGSWALGSCGAVQLCSLRTGLDLLTASLQTVGGRHLLRQFHHSPLNSFHPKLLSISSFWGGGGKSPHQDRFPGLAS